MSEIGSYKGLTLPKTGMVHAQKHSITCMEYILNFSKKWRGRDSGMGGFKMRENRKETALRAVSLSSQMSL